MMKTWQPLTGSETIPCGCGQNCGHRTCMVNEDSYPGTQEIVVEKVMDNGDQAKVITYLPPPYRVCKEVDAPAPADPFMPDWSQAPRWASWSTVDWTGHWSFWQYAPRHESIWYCGSGDMITLDDDGDAVLDMTGRDDRNSLRHRPA